MSLTSALRGRYPTTAAIALLGLCPNVLLQTGLPVLDDRLGSDLGAGVTGLQVAHGLGNAAYAVGAVLAAQLGLRFLQRRLFLGYEALFVAGSLLGALATSLPVLTVALVVQGLAAGAMLIASLPPLVTRFGSGRLPLTVVVINIGIFGVSTLGPIIGSAIGAAGASWRLMMWLAVVLGVLGWVVALVGYPRFDPPEPDAPFDRSAAVLVVVATVPTFLATALLSGSSPTAAVVAVPFLVGIAALGAMLLVELRSSHALIPVRALSTQLPVTGTMVAMVGGAVFVALADLLRLELVDVAGMGLGDVAWRLAPMPVGLAVAAVLFGVLLRTRFLPVLVDAGLAALAAAAGLLLVDAGSDAYVLAAALLLGFGAGATVSPGLFLTGLGMPSTQLGRAFALVQLLRSIATYAVAPVVLYVAESRGDLPAGIRVGLGAMAAVAVAGLLAALVLPALSGARLRTPDLDAWLDGDRALPSPATATHLRPGSRSEAAEPLLPRRRR